MLDKGDFQPLHSLADVHETIARTRKKTIEHIEKEVIK